MPNNPKQAYCTKFLLRMRTQPPMMKQSHHLHFLLQHDDNLQCYLTFKDNLFIVYENSNNSAVVVLKSSALCVTSI